jgi:hypothetical protein
VDEAEWTGEHGEKVEVDDMSRPPQYVQGMPLAGIERELADAYAAFDEQCGQTDAIRGHNPPQVRAAWHFDILREEGMTLTNADMRPWEDAYTMSGRFALAIAKRYYSPERVLEIVGRDRAGAAITFRAAKITTDIRIQPGSLTPRNHALQEGKKVELLEKGAFIDPATGRNDTRTFWEMMELGTLNRGVSAEQRQRTRAREEMVLMLRKQEPVIPFLHEDHDIHLEEHLADMARPEWYQAGEKSKSLALAHMQTHRDMLADMLAPEPVGGGEPIVGIGDQPDSPAQVGVGNMPEPLEMAGAGGGAGGARGAGQ